MSNDDGNNNKVGVDFGTASGPTIKAERREERPVHISIVMDATKSREMSIENAKTDFAKQMQRLKEITQSVSSLENLHISLFSFGETGSTYHGIFDDPTEVSAAFDQIECTGAPTQICSTLQHAQDLVLEHGLVPIDAALVIGDTADSGRMTNLNKEHPNFFRDTHQNLRETGVEFGAPIITMLDETDLRDGVGTHWFDKPAMQELSESSGVFGCPIDHDADITFTDYVAAVAAIRSGPEAVQELQESGLVGEKAWSQFSQATQETIHRPAKVIYRDMYPYRHCQSMRDIQEGLDGNRRRITFWGALGSTLAAAGLACCLLKNCNDGTVEAISTSSIETNFDSFSESGRLTFNEVNKPVNFEQNSAQVTEHFALQLDELGKYLEENPDEFNRLIITGHTSTEGTEHYNSDLSFNRAQAVVNYLNEYFEIPFTLEARGAGESTPRFTGDYANDGTLLDSDKAAANRRVVFESVLGR